MSRNSIIRWVTTHPVPLLVSAVVLVAAVAAGVAVAGLAPARPAASAVTATVDADLQPSVAQIDSLGGLARDVGVLAYPDGIVEDVVLDEVMLYARTPADLEDFLARWDGVVLDSFAPDADGGQDHLVRVDVDRADTDRIAAGPTWQAGDYRVSDERVTGLLALTASAPSGLQVQVNPLVRSQSIGAGRAYEAEDVIDHELSEPENAFEWSYLREGGVLDTGVARAWQILLAEQRLEPQVRFMVVDGGFARNQDFPDNSTIRKGSWGEKNTVGCGDDPCPWHGTHIVMAAAAKVGNHYGVAGPAGPVISKLVAVRQGSDYWTSMRRTVDMAEDEKPDVVNLSFAREVNGGNTHARTWTDRRMSQVRDTGALIVAAAGNNGAVIDAATDRYYLPCQSPHVLCVGGVDRTGEVHENSNRGRSINHRSVELFGPMCVLSLADPSRALTNWRTDWVCGTSYASPFVGGVAALVMAANPDLDADEVRRILIETAHADVGGTGVVTKRRVNAQAAVVRALDAPPTVTISSPADGAELSVGQWVDLRGTATDVAGNALPLTWHSDVGGHLADGSETSTLPLAAGTHVITASATDSHGRTGEASVTVTVVDTPPEVHIISPPEQAPAIFEGTAVELRATSWDPDTYAPVPDDQTMWYVWRDGDAIHVDRGHRTTLPAAEVVPGSYRARFLGGVSSVERTFVVSALPPGQVPPTATITAPSAGLELSSPNGNPRSVEFAGSGTDGHGAAVHGTRMRWVAYGTHETKVLCQGSGVPGGGGSSGGFLLPRDCASFSADIGLEHGLAETTWSVWLEVYDSDGTATPIATASVDIVVRLVVG
jgi:serine protease